MKPDKGSNRRVRPSQIIIPSAAALALLGGCKGTDASDPDTKDTTLDNPSFSTPITVAGLPGQATGFSAYAVFQPSLADIDKDGDLDIFAGTRKADQIVIFFLNNSSSGNLTFLHDTSTYTNLPTNSGPTMASDVVPLYVAASDIDLDADKDIDLIAADNYYDATDLDKFVDGGIGNFPSSAGSNMSISISPTRGAVALTDLDGDGYSDLIIGYNKSEFISSDTHYPQFVRCFTNNKSGDFTTGNNIIPSFETENELKKRFPIPSFADLDNDGDQDMFVVMQDDGTISYYENTGTKSSPAFTKRTGTFGITPPDGEKWFPAFGDMDGDGDLDAMIGTSTGKILYAENTDIE